LADLLSPWPAAYPIFLRSGQLSWPCGPPQNQFFSGPGWRWLWFYFDETKDDLVTVFKGTIRRFF
jgi:hypothetical protein